jgi:hypothetical protein
MRTPFETLIADALLAMGALGAACFTDTDNRSEGHYAASDEPSESDSQADSEDLEALGDEGEGPLFYPELTGPNPNAVDDGVNNTELGPTLELTKSRETAIQTVMASSAKADVIALISPSTWKTVSESVTHEETIGPELDDVSYVDFVPVKVYRDNSQGLAAESVIRTFDTDCAQPLHSEMVLVWLKKEPEYYSILYGLPVIGGKILVGLEYAEISELGSDFQ